MTNRCKKAALRLRKQGISVIPVGKDKKPLFPWKEFSERIATAKEIKKWWTKYPDANLAIVTGKISDLTVVDIEEGGITNYLPETLTVKTGGGGYHFYYRYTDKFKNAVRIKELTDIRNDSGYCIAPPSLHKSGKFYEYSSRKKIAKFPEHLFFTQIIKQKKNDWPELMKGAPAGRRNETAAKVCGMILTKTPMSMWEYIAWPAVRDWNTYNKPPLEEDELRLTFDSICGRVLFSQNDAEKEILDLKELAKRHKESKKEENAKVVPTGYQVLDSYLNGGVRPGDLVLVGARPSVGKSSFALSVAYNAAKLGKSVLFFSIEMTSLDLYERLLSFDSGLSCTSIINGTASKKKLIASYENLSVMPISVAELSKATSKDVQKIVEAELMEKKIDLIVVDYLQFLSDKQTKNSSDSSRVGNISRNLKALARSTMIPVLCPTQLNRKPEEGGRVREPRLADLRDSGQLEQDADVVILLHRKSDGDEKDKTSIIVAKNRKGETGRLNLNFNLNTTKFDDDNN